MNRPHPEDSSAAASHSLPQPLHTPALLPAPQGTLDDVSASVVVRLVCEEQRLRWQRGERPAAELLLARHPVLRVSEEDALDIIYNEVVLREENGDKPKLDEYLQRFPQYAEPLRQQFSFHVALFQSIDGQATPSGTALPSGAAGQLPSGATPPMSGVPGSNAPTDYTPLVASTSGLQRTLSMATAPHPAMGLRNTPSPSPKPTAHPLDVPTIDSPVPPVKPGKSRRSPQPDHVAGYEIVGTLGRGGMGVVYKAWQINLKRMVALKMILAGTHASADQLSRFRGEAEAIARLQHPGIVQIYEIGEEHGQPFFSLEFVAGGALDRKIDGTPQPLRWAAELTETLCKATHAAHQAGVVHRDLKPANVLLTLDGAPKITDFGLAKQLEEEAGQTRSGAVVGTPSYMSPEQAIGNTKLVGPPTDVYALGAILYELLTGRPPFKGDSAWETVRQVLNDEPVVPRQLRPQLPRDLETICLKAMEKSITKRYASAQELADDLRRYLNGEPIQARPASLLERGVKFARRKPYVVAAWAASVFAVVSLVAFGGYLLYRGKLDAEAEVRRLKDLEERRVEAGFKVTQGEEAYEREDWRRADSTAGEALALTGADPAMADIAARARRLRDNVQRDQQVAHHRYEANRYAIQATDEGDEQGQARAGALQAQAGLALLGLSAAQAAPPDPSLAPAVRRKLVEAAYELYFTWADVLTLDAAPPAERVREALRILERAPQLGLQTQSYHRRRARLLHLLGDKAAADREVELARAQPVAGAVDHFLLAQDYYRIRDFSQALVHLKAVVELEPDHYWAHFYQAGCHLQTRRAALALGDLSLCIKMKPDVVWPYLVRGLVHGELDNFDAALADFDKAEKLNPDATARYGIHTNRGVVRVRHGQFDEAIADIQQAIALRPKQYNAHANLAEVYLRQGKIDEALAALDRAIELSPSAALHRTRARQHIQRGNFTAALPDLEQAIARTLPGTRSLDLGRDHLERGRILYLNGKMSDALNAFDRSLTAVPDKAVSAAQQQELIRFHAEAEQLRGEAFLELNKLEECVAALEKSMQLAPSTSTHHRARGLALAKLTRYAEAIEDYTRALELDRLNGKPTDPQTLCYRGWAYIIQEAPKLAQRDFDAALKLPQADRIDCHNGRGYALVLLGQWKPAVADADAVVNLKPDLPRHLYNAARIYAQVAGRAVTPPGQDDRPLQELRRRCEFQAVKQIRAALDRTPPGERAAFWNEYVKNDPALSGIRRGSFFAEMLNEMKAVGR